MHFGKYGDSITDGWLNSMYQPSAIKFHSLGPAPAPHPALAKTGQPTNPPEHRNAVALNMACRDSSESSIHTSTSPIIGTMVGNGAPYYYVGVWSYKKSPCILFSPRRRARSDWWWFIELSFLEIRNRWWSQWKMMHSRMTDSMCCYTQRSRYELYTPRARWFIQLVVALNLTPCRNILQLDGSDLVLSGKNGAHISLFLFDSNYHVFMHFNMFSNPLEFQSMS